MAVGTLRHDAKSGYQNLAVCVLRDVGGLDKYQYYLGFRFLVVFRARQINIRMLFVMIGAPGVLLMSSWKWLFCDARAAR